MYDPRKHHYFEKLVKLIEENPPPRGRITDVDIYHDGWCHIYRGGYCNCEPEVKLRAPPERN